MAAMAGFVDIIALLIKYGIPLNATNSGGKTARELAELNGFTNIVAILDADSTFHCTLV